jgi:hypothetical protein
MRTKSWRGVALEGTFQEKGWPGFEAGTILDAIAQSLNIVNGRSWSSGIQSRNHRRSRERRFVDRRFLGIDQSSLDSTVCVPESSFSERAGVG